MTNGMPSQASNIRIRTTTSPTRSPSRSTNSEQAEERRSGRPLRRSRQWIQLTRSSRARSYLGSNDSKEEADRRPVGTPSDGTREDLTADSGHNTEGEGAAPARRSVRDRDPLDFMVELALLPARMTLATAAETLEYSRRVLAAKRSVSPSRDE
jgi:hypothetical protein